MEYLSIRQTAEKWGIWEDAYKIMRGRKNSRRDKTR